MSEQYRIVLDGPESYEALENAQRHGCQLQLCSVGHWERWQDFPNDIQNDLRAFPPSRYRAVVPSLGHAEDEAPFAYCFTDVNGRPTEFTDGPEHAAPEDSRIITALFKRGAPKATVPEGVLEWIQSAQGLMRALGEASGWKEKAEEIDPLLSAWRRDLVPSAAIPEVGGHLENEMAWAFAWALPTAELRRKMLSGTHLKNALRSALAVLASEIEGKGRSAACSQCGKMTTAHSIEAHRCWDCVHGTQEGGES